MMFKAKLKAASFAMSYLTNPQKLASQIQKLEISPSQNLGFINQSGIKVSAVNFRVRPYQRLSDYVGEMNGYVADAVSSGAQLVAFPELSGMAAASLMPGFSSIVEEGAEAFQDPDSVLELFREVCCSVQGFVGEIFLNTFCALARQYRVLIAAGSIYQTEGGRIFNRSYLFSEDGQVAGIQDKLFLSPFEQKAGASAGTRLTPASTKIGRIALLTAYEAAQYEPFLVASDLGCPIAVAGASPFGDDPSLSRFRAQEAKLFVVSPGLLDGEGFHLSLCAPAAVYAPLASTRTRDGVVAREGVQRTLTARVDLVKVSTQFDIYTADRNQEFLKRFFLEKENGRVR